MNNCTVNTIKNSNDFEKNYFNAGNIPEELKEYDQWSLWKLEPRNERLTKVPYTVDGHYAKVNNPETWTSFDKALEAYQNNPGTYSGLGFVLTENDPFTCIDFDHVYNPITEEWNQQALGEIKKLNSYTEFSPSGTGVHVFVIGKTTKPGTRRKQTDGTGREMYSDLHYMTVTGNHLPETPLEINEAQEVTNELYEKWFPEKMEVSAKRKASVNDVKIFEIPKSFTNNPNSPLKGLQPTKDQVIELCKEAPSDFGEKFNRVFDGDISKYESKSEADMALAGMIAFHTSNYGIIKEIIHESALWDNKWERDDYCQRTIMTAIRNRWGRY